MSKNTEGTTSATSTTNTAQLSTLSTRTDALNIKNASGSSIFTVNTSTAGATLNGNLTVTGNLAVNGSSNIGGGSGSSASQHAILDAKTEQTINAVTNTSIVWDTEVFNNIAGLVMNGNKITNTTSETMVLQTHYSFRTRSVSFSQHQINCWATAESKDSDLTAFQSQIIGQNLVISGSDNGSTTGSGILRVAPGSFVKVFCWVSTGCVINGTPDPIFWGHLQLERIA